MFSRFVKQRVEEALEDTRVVLISGPRQSGKTTLAQEIARDRMEFFTLDDQTTREAALSDPVGFLRGLDRAVIDEVQRAPDLLLAIKAAVDRDKRPGRFLLTGSANLMSIRGVADSLAGRMETIPLFPLSQSEIVGRKSTFVDNLVLGKRPATGEILIGDDLIDVVARGGYPEAITRQRWSRRIDWLRGYAQALLQRDVREIAQIEHGEAMPRLLSVTAEHSGQLVNHTAIGAAAGLNRVTSHRYLGVLESLFLFDTVQPWFNNRLSRLTKSPKLHFLDSGLLAAIRGFSPEYLRENRSAFGTMLEPFIYGEVRKISGWSEQRVSFFHFRDREGIEVDLILETPAGGIAGIEIKASATVAAGDFKGLRKLAESVPEKFIQGVVLYDGDQVVPFGEKLFAVPISALWSDG